MKRRGFLKRLALVGVTAAISTDLAFKTFSPEKKRDGILGQIGNASEYSELTTKKLESIIEDVFFKNQNKQREMVIYTGSGGAIEFNKAMRRI